MKNRDANVKTGRCAGRRQGPQSWWQAMAVFAGLALLCGCNSSEARGPAASPGSAAPQWVQVSTVEEQPVERALSVLGDLAAQDEVVVTPKVAGRLKAVLADIGARVASGEVLAEIEPRDYELRVRRAEAALAQARAVLGLDSGGSDDGPSIEETSDVRRARALLEEAASNRDRVRRLSEQQILSQSELDRVEAAHSVALSAFASSLEEARQKVAVLAERRVELDIAKQQLQDTRITAPFAGVVQGRFASIGGYVSIGVPVIELVRVDPLRLKMDVPERHAAKVRKGQKVRVQVEGAELGWCTIERVSPALDRRSRTLRIEADVPNHAGKLHPGAFARADILIEEDLRAPAVPKRSIVTFAGLEKVFVVEGGRAVERGIRSGVARDDWTEVISGVKPGEVVILDPGDLRDGDPVKVQKQPEGT